MSVNKKKALFICLGNICRSPIAEGVFQKTVNDMNQGDSWEIDSAAIGGWHVGNPPDYRALDTMKNHNVPYNNTARQIVSEDFNTYDYIFGMDNENMKDLNRRAPKNCKAKLLLFGNYDPEGDKIIRDPYYVSNKYFDCWDCFPYCTFNGWEVDPGRFEVQIEDSDAVGFEKCYQQSVRCSRGFLEHLENETK